MLINEDDVPDNELKHYGIKRRSGRYPWGSGQTPEERGSSFMGELKKLRAEGLDDNAIAKGFGMNSSELRDTITIAGNVQKMADIAMAERLKKKNLSNMEIGRRMNRNESSVRALLAPGAKDKADILGATSDMLRNRVETHTFVDVGKGVANQMGLTNTKLGSAVALLKSEGYELHRVPIPQLGTTHETNTKVLCPPGTEWKTVMQNRDKIVTAKDFSTDGGRKWDEIKPPMSLDSKRVQVLWGPEGGSKADGVIYVRPGVKDLDLGGTHYAQVRILVDGTHYLKGMAVLKNDLPPGVDVQFNSNKAVSANKHDAMKPIKDDPENPFGSSINRQIKDEHGKVTSVMNKVNEEVDWDDWSKNLASQMLSKQKPELIHNQLELTYAKKKAQLDEILALTNPTVKERLLRSYADDMDSSAVHLKAAAMPRQKTHVILPINSLKEHEVYAPNYRDGERVVLVRYPHGGPFEIPELTVNNRNAQARKILGTNISAAIGINHKVASILSGADFDGDTVVVIPNNHGRIHTEKPLPGLQDFDPQKVYPGFPGMKVMKNTQTEMGMISNLITDMTIRGANHQELAAAVRHSMVVIDAEKKELNYKQSALDNNIATLRKKYQPREDGGSGGAKTLIARTTGDKKVPDFKPRPASEGGPIDKDTGKLVFVPTNKTYNKRTVDPKTGEVTWVPTPKLKTVQRGSLVDDAHKLIDGEGTTRERMYADYSNSVRALANKARLEMVHNTNPLPYSPSAKAVYHKEVASLNVKLNDALKNAPLERQAQVIANAQVRMKRAAQPDMDSDVLKKVTSQELKKARARTGADKQQVQITAEEWKAIQQGAITPHKLKSILDNADIDQIKELATPRTTSVMPSAKVARAKALTNAGYTQAEIAEELGVSVSTIKRGLTTS